MKRRTFLKALGILPLATAVLPDFITGGPIQAAESLTLGGLKNTFRVAFPDGTTWSFAGFVKSAGQPVTEKDIADLMMGANKEDVTLTVEPVGPMTFGYCEPKRAPASLYSGPVPAHPTLLTTAEGVPLAEIQEIHPPTLSPLRIETTGLDGDNTDYIPGLRRDGEFSMTVNFTK